MSRALRQEANRLILERLRQEIETHPDLRFGQILVNLGVLDTSAAIYPPQSVIVRNPFNEESTHTLSRMEDTADKRLY